MEEFYYDSSLQERDGVVNRIEELIKRVSEKLTNMI